MVKYALFSYSKPQAFPAAIYDRAVSIATNPNLGDYIQSLAVQQHLPRVDGYLPRDRLNEVEGGPWLVPMNGWFSHIPENWPPSESVVPVFFGFHLTGRARHSYLSERGVAYLKRHAPIGCRDDGTRDMLLAEGIDAFTSGCLSCTFPQRQHSVDNGVVFLIDCPDWVLSKVPNELQSRAVRHSHVYQGLMTDALKYKAATELLSIYQHHAELIVTARLHCALPCVAMGIPVIFVRASTNQDVYRTEIITDLVQTIHEKTPSWRVDWKPRAVDIEEQKASCINAFLQMLTSRKQIAEGLGVLNHAHIPHEPNS